MSLLSVSALRVAYGPVQAVRGVDLRVEAGEIVALLGSNGAGKSSTLNALVGLTPSQADTIAFDGKAIAGLATEHLVRRGITLTPEGRRVFAGLTVEENLRIGAYSAQDAAPETLERLYALFPILAERRRQRAGTLSGGQQQQLAIARSLMSSPRLLLLDEPSLGLAPRIVETIFALIESLRDEGLTILLVEQNVAMSLAVADRGYVMASGEIVTEGTAAALRDSHVVEQAYLGHA